MFNIYAITTLDESNASELGDALHNAQDYFPLLFLLNSDIFNVYGLRVVC